MIRIILCQVTCLTLRSHFKNSFLFCLFSIVTEARKRFSGSIKIFKVVIFTKPNFFKAKPYTKLWNRKMWSSVFPPYFVPLFYFFVNLIFRVPHTHTNVYNIFIISVKNLTWGISYSLKSSDWITNVKKVSKSLWIIKFKSYQMSRADIHALPKYIIPSSVRRVIQLMVLMSWLNYLHWAVWANLLKLVIYSFILSVIERASTTRQAQGLIVWRHRWIRHNAFLERIISLSGEKQITAFHYKHMLQYRYVERLLGEYIFFRMEKLLFLPVSSKKTRTGHHL